MSAFRFVAARPDGRPVRGRLEAPSRAEAAGQLSDRGLYPLVVEAALATALPIWRRPSRGALAVAVRGLATLVSVGVPLVAALETTRRLTSGPLGAALERVSARVREGGTLGAALGAEAGLVPAVTVGLVRAGEHGVGLGAALEAAASELEREAETAASIRAALAYPVVLLVVGGTSLLVIVLVVVPRFAEVLGDVRASLPLATRGLLAVSALLREHARALTIVLGVAGASVAAWLLRRRAAWHRWLLTMPVVGELRLGAATMRAARVLGVLLGTGSPATAALRVAREAAGDVAVAQRLGAAAERVMQGAALSAALAAERAMTPLALRLAAVGDGTGQMPSLLRRAADMEAVFVTRRVRTLVSLIEPLLIVAFAAVVAFVALAMLQAVYSLRPAGL